MGNVSAWLGGAMAVLSVAVAVSRPGEAWAGPADPVDTQAIGANAYSSVPTSETGLESTTPRMYMVVGAQLYARLAEGASAGAAVWNTGYSSTAVAAPVPVPLRGHSLGSQNLALFVVDGPVVKRLRPSDGVPQWTVPLGRTGCTGDRLTTPSVQLWDYSNSSFQGTFSTDVVIVQTAYSMTAGTSPCQTTTLNQVYGLRASDGAVLWQYNANGQDQVGPIYSAGAIDYASNRVIFGADSPGSNDSQRQNTLFALSTLDGTRVWAQDSGTGVWGTPFLVPQWDKVYIAGHVGRIEARQASSGVLMYGTATPNPGSALIVDTPWVETRSGVLQGTVLARTNNGFVHKFTDTGSAFNLGWSQKYGVYGATSNPVMDVTNGVGWTAGVGKIHQFNVATGVNAFTACVSTAGTGTVWQPFTTNELGIIAGQDTLTAISKGTWLKYRIPWDAPGAGCAMARAGGDEATTSAGDVGGADPLLPGCASATTQAEADAICQTLYGSECLVSTCQGFIPMTAGDCMFADDPPQPSGECFSLGASCLDALCINGTCTCVFADPPNETCLTGGGVCADPQATCCGTAIGCVNLASDFVNCGACGTRCADGQTCSAGTCVASGCSMTSLAPVAAQLVNATDIGFSYETQTAPAACNAWVSHKRVGAFPKSGVYQVLQSSPTVVTDWNDNSLGCSNDKIDVAPSGGLIAVANPITAACPSWPPFPSGVLVDRAHNILFTDFPLQGSNRDAVAIDSQYYGSPTSPVVQLYFPAFATNAVYSERVAWNTFTAKWVPTDFQTIASSLAGPVKDLVFTRDPLTRDGLVVFYYLASGVPRVRIVCSDVTNYGKTCSKPASQEFNLNALSVPGQGLITSAAIDYVESMAVHPVYRDVTFVVHLTTGTRDYLNLRIDDYTWRRQQWVQRDFGQAQTCTPYAGNPSAISYAGTRISQMFLTAPPTFSVHLGRP